MKINTILNGLSNFTQKAVNFLFNSKWTVWIILVSIVIYFVLKGNKAESNEE